MDRLDMAIALMLEFIAEIREKEAQEAASRPRLVLIDGGLKSDEILDGSEQGRDLRVGKGADESD